jgi:hypothetical protein
MIPGEFWNLIGLPNFTMTGCLTDKEKRRAFTMDLVIEI